MYHTFNLITIRFFVFVPDKLLTSDSAVLIVPVWQTFETTFTESIWSNLFESKNEVPAVAARTLQLRVRVSMVILLCKSPKVTYGNVKNPSKLKIIALFFNEPKNDTNNHHFVCKITEHEQHLLGQNYIRSRHHQLLFLWQVSIFQTISERFLNASEDSFKTTFCSFSHNSKHVCSYGKYLCFKRFPSGFRTLSKIRLKPHFAHFRTILNMFEQNNRW